MRHHHRLPVLAALSVFLLSAVMAQSVEAETRTLAGPTVISGFKDGPIAIPSSSLLIPFAALSVPAGNWVAWAKLYVVNNNSGDTVRTVTCALSSNGGPDHRGMVAIATGSYIDPTLQNLILSTSASFGTNGGQFYVACAADGTGTSANWLKVMAMKVGTLTRVDMATGGTTSTGSGSPRVMIGSRSGPIAVKLDTTTTVGKLSLGPGAWAIRASFNVKEYGISSARCRLVVGGTVRDANYVTVDTFDSMVVLDGVAGSSSAQTAKVTCTGEYVEAGGYDTLTVSDVRVTAVKLGTLVTYDRYGNPSVYGSGWPKVRYKTAPSRSFSQTQWADVASLDVEAGAWMVLAKARGSWDAGFNCDLLAVPDYDNSQSAGWPTELAFGVVHLFTQGGIVKLRCFASVGTASISGIRLTAFKLGSLQNLAL